MIRANLDHVQVFHPVGALKSHINITSVCFVKKRYSTCENFDNPAIFCDDVLERLIGLVKYYLPKVLTTQSKT